MQETFLRAYSRLEQYRPQWRFSTWLFTIARRTSINYHRRPQPAADQQWMQQVVSPAAGPEQLAVTAESRQYLWSTAARILGDDELAALWLHYVEEMPVGEIATVLGRSSVAVKTMMFRAARSSCRWSATWSPKGGARGRQDRRRSPMDKRKPLEDHDPLAEPMRREAQRTRPEFSTRSTRVCVRQSAACGSLGPPAAVAFHRKLPARLLSWAVSAAISVALLVCLALFFHTPGQPIGPSTVQTRPWRSRATDDRRYRVYRGPGGRRSDGTWAMGAIVG